MYGIFIYIWLKSMVNVRMGKYTIHGSYGYSLPGKHGESTHFLLDNWKYLSLGGFQVHGNEREKRLLLPGRWWNIFIFTEGKWSKFNLWLVFQGGFEAANIIPSLKLTAKALKLGRAPKGSHYSNHPCSGCYVSFSPWTPKPWKMKVLHPQYMGYKP